MTVNALFDRTKPGFGAYGLDGGSVGGPAAILVKRAGETDFRTFSEVFGTVSPSKFTNIVLTGGDEVLIASPGGGGYGEPARARAGSGSQRTSRRGSYRTAPRVKSTARQS